MAPPFVRVVHELPGPGGVIHVWDLRVAQPNVSHVPMPVLHSLEHFLGTELRTASEHVVMVGVMGCQTGLYIVTLDLGEQDLSSLVADALRHIVQADRVPLANNMDCGWAENHSLQGAKEIAMWLLRRRADWADAHEA